MQLSEPKEYQLKVGAKKSRFAVQISEAQEGMAIRYSFDAEQATLAAAMSLDFDEEDEDLGMAAPAAATTTSRGAGASSR